MVDTMKKMLLSLLVLSAFIFYSWHEREEISQLPPVLQKSDQQPVLTPSSSSSPPPTTTGGYKDGIYTGDIKDAFYGNVQVRVTINNGTLEDVVFLQYPDDRQTSIKISNQAMPLLRQEAISIQDSQVDIVSGATDTSIAFRKSLQSALDQASL